MTAPTTQQFSAASRDAIRRQRVAAFAACLCAASATFLARLCAAPVALAACFFAASTFAADAFPTRQVRMMIPFPAGGPADFVGRLFAQHLTDLWGEQVVTDNRAGASGII